MVICRNHNWFHGVTGPLEPVRIGNIHDATPAMTRQQAARVAFYRALIELVHILRGQILVAEVSTSMEAPPGDNIAAILLWLPPNKRLGALDIATLWRSGFIPLMVPWRYGVTGFHRIDVVYEANVKSMFAKTLKAVPPNGYREHDCGFVQMVAINPSHAGKGYAATLLKYQIDRHFQEYPDRPVVLDTTTTNAIKVYEKLGFRLLAETPVDTGTDAGGFPLSPNADEATKKLARETCVQRVMLLLPPERALDFDP